MSQRALKKRDQKIEVHQPMYRKHSKYIQRTNGNSKHTTNRISSVENKSYRHQVIKQKCSSTPNLTTIDEDDNDFRNRHELIRSNSESDLSKLRETNVLAHAKSEFHLTSIASTQVASENLIPIMSTCRLHKMTANTRNTNFSLVKQLNGQINNRSTIQVPFASGTNTDHAITSNTFHLPSPPHPATSSKVDCTDSSNIRIPIVGFEVMEERARFTVNFRFQLDFL